MPPLISSDGDGEVFGSVAGSGSRDGKRKWGDHGNRGVTGSASSKSDYMGVRNRGFTVEIKRWFEGLDFYKDVKMSEGEAAMVHDLARLFLDITWDRLNIQALESRMQEHDPALAKFDCPLRIGKDFLIGFVEEHPLKKVGGTLKERADSMKEEIIALAPPAYKRLKEKITREHSSQAGRQKKEVDEISSLVQLNNENQDLKATISAQNVAFEAKDAEILSLKEEKEEKDAEILFLKEGMEEKDAEIIPWKEAYDVALKAINAAQEGRDIVREELYAAKQAARAAGVTPFKAGVAEREEFHQIELNPASETWIECVDWTTISRHYPTGNLRRSSV